MDEFRKLKERAKQNPDALLKSVYGEKWYDVLTEYRLNGGNVPELVTAAVDEKLEAFQKQQAEERAKLETERKAQVEREAAQLRAEFAADVAGFIKSKAEDYELISLYQSEGLVAQYIEAEYEKTGRMIPTKEAADLVEQHLLSQAAKALNTKKLKAKATPQPEGADKRNESQQRRTLSNDMTASTAATTPPARTDEERRKRALAAMEQAQKQRVA